MKPTHMRGIVLLLYHFYKNRLGSISQILRISILLRLKGKMSIIAFLVIKYESSKNLKHVTLFAQSFLPVKVSLP